MNKKFFFISYWAKYGDGEWTPSHVVVNEDPLTWFFRECAGGGGCLYRLAAWQEITLRQYRHAKDRI